MADFVQMRWSTLRGQDAHISRVPPGQSFLLQRCAHSKKRPACLCSKLYDWGSHHHVVGTHLWHCLSTSWCRSLTFSLLTMSPVHARRALASVNSNPSAIIIPLTICSTFETIVPSGCRDKHWFTRGMWDLQLTLAGMAVAAAATAMASYQSARLLAAYLTALYKKVVPVHIKIA